MPELILPDHMVDNQAPTRKKIITNNIKLLSTLCYCDVSLDQLANKCGIRKQSILYHFSSKLSITIESVETLNDYHKKAIQKLFNEDMGFSTLIDAFITLIERTQSTECCGRFISRLMSYTNENTPELTKALNENTQIWESAIAMVIAKAETVEHPEGLARLVFSKLQGSIIMSNVNPHAPYLKTALIEIKQMLTSLTEATAIA